MAEVEFNAEAFRQMVRSAVSHGLNETSLEAVDIATQRMPKSRVKVATRGRGKTVYAVPASDPSGYPGRRNSSLHDSLTTAESTPQTLAAGFGVFGGKKGVVKFAIGSGGAGYPLYLERKPITEGGRRWARRTVTENVGRLRDVFLQEARARMASGVAQ